MKFLWEIDALMAAVDGRPVGEMPDGITGISIDTRTLKEGEAFFAIKGDRFDGHDFLVSAMRAGAAVAVVDSLRDALPILAPYGLFSSFRSSLMGPSLPLLLLFVPLVVYGKPFKEGQRMMRILIMV